MRLSPLALVAVVGSSAALPHVALSDVFTWNQAAAGSGYNWNDPANWLPNSGFPNAAADTANLNNDIAGSQTIRLQQGITIGTLNLGDSDGSHTFTISSGTGAQTLTFQSATAGGATALNIGGTGTVTNTISANVTLGGTSNLTLNMGGTQNLNLSGLIDINGNTLTVTGTGGTLNIGSATANPGVTGAGTIVKNNTGTMNFNSGNSNFTGNLILNAGTAGIVNGQFHAASATINGAINSAAAQLGGTLTVGSGTSFASAPNNRVPVNVTMNGGEFNAGGQPLDTAAGTVLDELNSLNVNSGYSRITLQRGGDDNHFMEVADVNRGDGATLALRSSTLGSTAKLLVDDAMASESIGGGGAAGTTTMSIIPWLVAANANASASHPGEWGAYVAGEGVRALNTGEYATPANTAALLALPDTSNVKSNSGLGNNTSKIINSLIRTSGGTVAIGTNSTLTLAGGALLFQLGGAGMGTTGAADAGTLSFGTAEGVVWSTSINVNTIGAVIAGSGGLTKAGTGTLILTGANTYTGDTHVSSGTLRVGNGTNASTLGDGYARVHNGALLDILSADVIDDDEALILDAFGLVNGKVNIGASLIETVGSLSLGGVLQGAGYYGSSAASAANNTLTVVVNNTFFTGDGLIQVVPEPASVLLIGSGLALMLGRRR